MVIKTATLLKGGTIFLTFRGTIMQRHRSAVINTAVNMVILLAHRMDQLAVRYDSSTNTNDTSSDWIMWDEHRFIQFTATIRKTSVMAIAKKLILMDEFKPCLTKTQMLMILDTIPKVPAMVHKTIRCMRTMLSIWFGFTNVCAITICDVTMSVIFLSILLVCVEVIEYEMV